MARSGRWKDGYAAFELCHTRDDAGCLPSHQKVRMIAVVKVVTSAPGAHAYVQAVAAKKKPPLTRGLLLRL